MALAFHLVFFIHGRPSIRLELRVLGSLAFFWILEDFLWFVLNPAYGLLKFNPGNIPWHHHWLLGVPTDYVVFLTISSIFIWLSFRRPKLKFLPVKAREPFRRTA